MYPAPVGALRVKLTGIDVPSSSAPYDGYHGDTTNHELCLIDAGIKNLRDVPLFGSNIQTLNLHCNQIAQIENLQVR